MRKYDRSKRSQQPNPRKRKQRSLRSIRGELGSQKQTQYGIQPAKLQHKPQQLRHRIGRGKQRHTNNKTNGKLRTHNQLKTLSNTKQTDKITVDEDTEQPGTTLQLCSFEREPTMDTRLRWSREQEHGIRTEQHQRLRGGGATQRTSRVLHERQQRPNEAINKTRSRRTGPRQQRRRKG